MIRNLAQVLFCNKAFILNDKTIENVKKSIIEYSVKNVYYSPLHNKNIKTR